MYRHRLDAVSLFFGLVLTAVGAFVVFSDNASHFFVGPWLLPTLFVAGGVVLLAGLVPSRVARGAADPVGTTDPDVEEPETLEW